MERTLRIINCPCCGSVLYTLRLEGTSGTKTWRLTKDSPSIKADHLGSFMNCARCAKRITLTIGDELQSPGFEVAPLQDCGDA